MNDSPKPKDSRHRWVWVAALAGSLVFASGNNPPEIPGSLVGLDKIAHFSLFGLLATAVLRTDRVWRRVAWRGWIAIGAVSLFGITDEWHQSFTPGRSVEFADWIADTTGALLAVTLYLRWGWYRRLLERRVGRQQSQECKGSPTTVLDSAPAVSTATE